jgi:hypothetical protein
LSVGFGPVFTQGAVGSRERPHLEQLPFFRRNLPHRQRGVREVPGAASAADPGTILIMGKDMRRIETNKTCVKGYMVPSAGTGSYRGRGGHNGGNVRGDR